MLNLLRQVFGATTGETFVAGFLGSTHGSDHKVIVTGGRIPDRAESEVIVASDHGAQYHQQAIREVERILKEHLTGKN
jgi:hypothetical protein